MDAPQDPAARATPIVRFAVERRVTTCMVLLGVIVLGWLSLERLPLEYLPSFSSSHITVSAPYRSSSPDEVERLIVRPLEDSLGTINGIDTLTANASADQGSVHLSFIDGTDMDMAAVDVRDRLDRVRDQLPSDLERVTVRRFQTSDIPVIRFDLSAKWPVARLYDFTETVVQRRLERLEGVAQVNVGGLRTPELQVNLDPARLLAHGIDVRSIVSRLRANNMDVSEGGIYDRNRKLQVRTVGHIGSVEEARNLPLDGKGLRLRDVADVVYDFPEKEDFNFLNGVEALTVSVNKNSTANVLKVADAVKNEMKAIAATPAADGLSYRIFQDASDDVRLGLKQLGNSGVIGGALAVIVMFLFLRRFRTTALVALAIPISVIATFVILYLLRQSGALDVTLNVVSLAGLMLALGMLVDNSVVVIESIFRHRIDLRKDARTAALDGTTEVALPIVASTATTLCVFLPVIFMAAGGRFKLYLQSIGITVCTVMIASLFVALTVVPMAATWLLRTQEARPDEKPSVLSRIYGSTIAFTLRHRILFVVQMIILLAGVIWLFSTIQRSFTGRSLERQVIINVDTPRQYSLDQTKALYDDVYGILDAHRDELDIADIAYAYDRGNGRSRGGWRRSRRFDVYLKDESESKLSTIQAREKIRALLPVKAGVDLRIAESQGHGGSAGIQVDLSGDDESVLTLIAHQVADRLATVPAIRDVDTSLESGNEEIHVRVGRARAVQSGVSAQAVAYTVNNALSGRSVSRYKTEDREVDLVVRYRQQDRETLEQLKQVPVFSPEGPLPLGAVADFGLATGPTSIERENHMLQVTVSANVANPTAAFGAMRQIAAMMSRLPMPPGYTWSFGEWNRRNQQDQAVGLFALLFALPLVYMLMAALFESFAQPFTIMFSIPFALLGVGVAMKAAAQPWDIMTMIGMLILIGVVVNNAIVLIDHINHLRRSGMSRDEAIIAGGRHRLRPILITAVTTIVGLLPLVAPFVLPQVFGAVEGRAATWAPIGLVIVGGLTTSTFLTLVIIPTIYSLVDDVVRFFRRVALEV